MEEEILDYDGEIKKCDPPQKMELIQKDDFFDVSALDVIRFLGENDKKRMEALISYAHVRNPRYG